MYKSYYELVNGVPKKIENPIKVTISNPTKEQLEFLGRKPREFDPTKEPEDVPEYDTEKQYLETKYVEKDTEIIKIYEVKDIEIVEEDKIPETDEEKEETISEEGEKVEQET